MRAAIVSRWICVVAEPVRIVIATPHPRNDALVERLSAHPELDVLRVSDKAGLSAGAMAAFDPAWIFFPHWSWIIPPEIHDRFRAVIFHMADVPYGRGGSPLQNLIVRGHRDTKLTALACSAGLDAGPVYLKRDLSLDGTAEQILRRASDLMEEMILTIVRESPEPVAQRGEPTLFRRRTPEQSDIATAATLDQLHDLIRMLDADGYPHAFARIGNFRLEFREAVLEEGRIGATVQITMEKKQ